MQKWEYKTLQLAMNEKENLIWFDAEDDERSVNARLNELGEEGWELVSVDTRSLSGVTVGTVYYLKRPVE